MNTACDGIWMQLMKSVFLFFFSVLFGTVPQIAYMLVWKLSKSVNDKYFIIAAGFASCILHIRQVLDLDWRQVT